MKPRPEAGFVAGGEVVLLGVVVLVFGTLVIANAWMVIDAKLAVSAAAREGARAYVEADDRRSADHSAVEQARAAMDAYGRSGERAAVSIDATSFTRCQPVSVRVTYRVPLLRLPVLGSTAASITTSSVHREVIDPYRSGLPSGPEDPCG